MDGILVTGADNRIGVGFCTPGFMPVNVITGGSRAGVHISGTGANNNIVSGNFIGVDATGLVALANREGVLIDSGASGNHVGDDKSHGAGVQNVISGNKLDGVQINSSSTNFVYQDYIGLGFDGRTAIGNGRNGVYVLGTSATNVIQAGNVISSNLGSGVTFSGSDATGNRIAGSLIGTDFLGTLARGNAKDGVTIDLAVSSMIGGGMGGGRNVISGNLGNGISITGTLNKVYGNWIGTEANGSLELPNQSNGVYVGGGDNFIGSSVLDTSNVISGNLLDGIAIAADNNNVVGNYIGTDGSGTEAAGNGGNGVSIVGNNNHVGLATAGGDNLISGNGASGVLITGNSNTVYGDTIGTNGAGNAALGNGTNGVTINGDNNSVGTAGAIVENLISGNGADGVYISGGNNRVYGSVIGTDFFGVYEIANVKNGVEIIGDNNEVGSDLIGGGNLISGNGNDGIYLYGNVNTVAQDWIGVDSSGNGALPNGQYGVEINYGSNNIIGIADATGANVISGNGSTGIYFGGSGNNNVMLNNDIGVGAGGKTAVGNGGTGITISGGGDGNIIGGVGAWNSNVISANGSFGIRVTGATGTRIMRNFIGVGADGMAALGNGLDGILVERGTKVGGAVGTVIGGADEAAGNVICNNGGFGVEFGNNTTGCTVQNNWIGVYFSDQDGWIDAPNKSGWRQDLNVGNTWTNNEHA